MRQAVNRVAGHQFDARGHRVLHAIDGPLADEYARMRVGQVAVPFGITRLRELIARVEDDLAELSDDDRALIDEAIAVVRKTRQTVNMGMPGIRSVGKAGHG